MRQRPERRKHRRLKRHFIVKFRIKSQTKPHKDKDEASAKWEMVTLQDLSAGGALFNYNEKIDVGTFIDFMIEFPLGEGDIQCVARVLRCNPIPARPLFGIAVIFAEISEEEAERINLFVEEIHLKHPDQFDD
ncbi:MAG: PilZ domain-containing protein [Candidatus Omnitrophica bacterium]|nr:PilZ domain-containing protein [Candidatus Omnitrophota bacterium]